MCKGFIKIPRRIYEERQWNVKRVYSELDAFYDIYASANARDRTEPDGTKIRRNQLVISYRSLADKWLWNQMKVKRFIQALERKGYIKVDSDRFKTILTIIDFGTEESKGVTQPVTPSVTPLLHQNPDKQRCSDTVGVTLPVTPSVTPTVTPSRVYKNDNYISCLNKEEEKNNIDSSLRSESLSTTVDASIDVGGFLTFFNDTIERNGSVICKVRVIQGQRLTMLKARIREHGKEAVYEVFDKASKSPFLNGNGNRGFVASIDWLLKPTNFLKTLEGNYDNNRSNGTTTTNQRYHQTTTDGHPSDSELRQQSIRIMQRLEREGADSDKQVWNEETVPF